jgi:hypothetical protein
MPYLLKVSLCLAWLTFVIGAWGYKFYGVWIWPWANRQGAIIYMAICVIIISWSLMFDARKRLTANLHSD